MPDTQKERLERKGAMSSHTTRPQRTSDAGHCVDLSPASLEKALAEGRIRAAYQPIVALDSGAVIAEEALARWITRDGSVIPAAAFIDTAAASGTLSAIDETVLTQTLTRCQGRRAAGQPQRLHFVNISTALLCAPDRLARLAGVVAACGTPIATDDPRLRSLVVEITEREPIPQLAVLAGMLHPLLTAGVRLALDDFGSGYSSFLYLADLPISFLKIERALVARAGRDARIDAMIQSIVCLAGELGITTIAEGIESAASAQAVAALGVSWGQGYHFGRPDCD